MWIIYFLCVIFSLLLFMQWYKTQRAFEGYENATTPTYQPYDPNNVFILAQQNAGNISVLKEQIGDVLSLKQSVTDLTTQVNTLQDQVNNLVLAQQQYATDLTGGTSPVITGT